MTLFTAALSVHKSAVDSMAEDGARGVGLKVEMGGSS